MTILELYMANSIDNTAGKIREKLNAVRNNRKVSAKRCIWEMMQNAKDVYNPKYGGVSIEFEIADDRTFIFRHNGLYFTLKNVTSLIQQVSSKSSTNEDENVTGMFGTGFISTHLIADVIDVKSVLQDCEGKFRYFDLKLDRSGASKEELAPRIKASMEEFAKLDDDPSGILFPFATDYENHTEDDFDTSFTYRIESDSQLQLALIGLNDLVNTLPVTMINLPRVKSVRVINRIDGTDVRYACTREVQDTDVVMSTITNGNVTKRYLSYNTEDVSLSIEINVKNGIWYAVKRDEKMPVLFRDFPLIGSHQFYFPYFLNGFRFVPTEARDDIQLHGDSDDKISVTNREIIEKAVEASLTFNQWLIDHNIKNRYLLASSRIPKSTVSWDEETSGPWIKNLQKEWRSKLLMQKLLESENDDYPISEMLLPDCSRRESREKFWELLCPVRVRKLPKKEDIHEWKEILVEYDSWNCRIKYSLEEFLKELSGKLNILWVIKQFADNNDAAYVWLNEVVKFTIDELGSDSLDKYAILPNQKGEFKKYGELYRDNSRPIPEQIKKAYEVAFEKNIGDILLDTKINVSNVSFIKEYNLISLIRDLNDFIKDSKNNYNNRRDVSYYLTQLYSSESQREHREIMNYLCSGFSKSVNSFDNVPDVPDELWEEGDRFLLSNIAIWITNECTSISKLGSDFLEFENNIDETKIIGWLNKYLKRCVAVQFTAHLEKYAIFPNQKGDLRELNKLSYDNNIPEEILDLSELAKTSINWRSCLLDKRIEGYSQHLPKNTSDVYRSISESFDVSNQQFIIAKHAIALNYKDDPDVSYIYKSLNDIYGDMPVSRTLTNADGFEWEKFIACAIEKLTGDVAAKKDVETLSSNLSNESVSYTDSDSIAWVDRLLNFVINYRGGRYKSKIRELENHGIWINQSGKFCMFSELSRDGGIAEELKDLAANNSVVNFDYRARLLHNDSSMVSVIESNNTISQTDVLKKIDESLETYESDKQNPEFRSLIFRIMEIDKRLHISDHMKYYRTNKEKLIVGSLGEGETMNMVANIIQQGDEKIKVVKEILEGNTLDELNKIKEILNTDSTKLKTLLEERTGSEATISEIEVTNFEGEIQKVKVDQIQYAGLSLKEIEQYIDEAKSAVVKYFRELDDQNNLGLQFDIDRIRKYSYSQLYGISDKNGNEIPIVVHSYKGSQYRYFSLNWYDWQMLSRKNSRLFVLTVNGLQCIPLYALPVRNFNIAINDGISDEKRAALLTLAAVVKRYSSLNVEFGNNMPYGFRDPVPFNYVPEQLEQCISSIKQVCDENIPQIEKVYNLGKNVPLKISDVGYSLAMKEYNETGTMRDTFDAPANDTMAPSVGTSFID